MVKMEKGQLPSARDTEVQKLTKMKKVRELNVKDGELKIPGPGNTVSRNITLKEKEELFLLNVENEIKAYSISKKKAVIGPKFTKGAVCVKGQRDFPTNFESKMAAHSICMPILRSNEEEKKNPPEPTGVTCKSNTKNESPELSLVRTRLSDNHQKMEETMESQKNTERNGETKFNGESSTLKNKHHKVVGNVNKDVYESLEYLIEDEEIVLNYIETEKYLVVEPSKNTKENNNVQLKKKDSNCKKSDEHDTVIESKKDVPCNKNNKDSDTQGTPERKRSKIDTTEETLESLEHTLMPEDLYQSLWDAATYTKLPSLLWSVHKASNKQFVAFSHTSPHSSDAKFVTDKVVMFENSCHPIVYLCGVRVNLPYVPKELESLEQTSIILRKIDKLPLCIGIDLSMQKHSAKCRIYFDRGARGTRCEACEQEEIRIHQESRVKYKKESLQS